MWAFVCTRASERMSICLWRIVYACGYNAFGLTIWKMYFTRIRRTMNMIRKNLSFFRIKSSTRLTLTLMCALAILAWITLNFQPYRKICQNIWNRKISYTHRETECERENGIYTKWLFFFFLRNEHSMWLCNTIWIYWGCSGAIARANEQTKPKTQKRTCVCMDSVRIAKTCSH